MSTIPFIPRVPLLETKFNWDGVSVTWELKYIPRVLAKVSLDGTVLVKDVDYSILANVITFDVAPSAGSTTTVSYYSDTVVGESVSQIFDGLTKISVGTIAPTSPSVGDLWIDTN